MPFTCARCGHVSRDPDEIRESYCASCGDWSPNASLAPEPAPPADLEYQCLFTEDQVAEILAAGRRLEGDVAAFEAGRTWYQRARRAVGRLIIGPLHAIGTPRLPVVPESDRDAWVNPYSWRSGDPEL